MSLLEFRLDSRAPVWVLLSLALNQELLDVIKLYIDDIIIASRTFDEHLNILQYLFERLINSNMTLSLEKSLFFHEEVPFLGVIISRERIRLNPNRLAVIETFPAPIDIKKYVDPFRDILRKNIEWRWTNSHFLHKYTLIYIYIHFFT